jgi:hypothetical protein
LPADVKLFEALEAVERDAAGGLDRAAQPLLFDRLSWFRLIARHCPPPGKMLAVRARSSWLFLSVSVSRARSFTAWYSLRFGLIGGLEGAMPIAKALKRRLGRMELAPVEDPEPLAAAFRAAGWIVRATPATASWRCATRDEDFAAYWARRPSKLRNTAARKAKAAALEIEIHRIFDPAAWADYETVYAASWKGEEGSPAFLRALAEEEGAAGTLRLGIAKKDGRPIAAQLWTVENGTAWIHKLAYDEEAKGLSPGTVLGMEMFRHALDEDRVERIDYGTGDEPYKRDWMDERATLWRLDAYNPYRLSGAVGALRAAAAALVRRLHRR